MTTTLIRLSEMTLTELIALYFERNPDEELTVGDACLKFGYSESMTRLTLQQMAERGEVSLREERKWAARGRPALVASRV